MIDIIIGLVVLAILAMAIGYMIRAKKRGVKCIGCSACSSSSASGCAGNCSGCSGCHHEE